MPGEIPPSGELIIALSAGLVFLVYVSHRWNRNDTETFHAVGWFTFWLAQFVKTVRSERLNLFGNGLVVLSVGLIFMTMPRKVRGNGSLVVSYLVLCTLAYAFATLLWEPDTERFRIWGASALVWFSLVGLHRVAGTREFCMVVFGGFRWLTTFVVGLAVLFAVVFPSGSMVGIRLQGPFGANDLGGSLFVLMAGLLYLQCDERMTTATIRRSVFVLFTALSAVAVLTLSRCAVLMSSLLLLAHIRRSGGHGRLLLAALVLVAVVFSAVVWAGIIEAHVLRQRVVESMDNGRITIARVMMEECKRRLWLGHGFVRAAQDTFVPSTDPMRDRGFSSHCGYLSVLYDYGVIGAALFVLLHVTVSVVLLRCYRSDAFCRCAFWVWLCFNMGALFEGFAWWPITPLGALAMCSIAIAANPSSARGLTRPPNPAELTPHIRHSTALEPWGQGQRAL